MKVSALQKNRKGGFTLIELMVVIAILAALGAIGGTAVLSHLKDGDKQMAKSNLKSVHTILQQFKIDHGNYPCDDTADEITEKNDGNLNFGPITGNTANDYLRQVFYDSNKNQSEKPFFAKLGSDKLTMNKEGDNKVAKGRALEAKENAMAYVMRKNPDEPERKLPVVNQTAPLAFCGVYPSATAYTGNAIDFDLVSFGGEAYILGAGGDVTTITPTVKPGNENVGVFAGKDADDSLFPQIPSTGEDTSPNYLILSPAF